MTKKEEFKSWEQTGAKHLIKESMNIRRSQGAFKRSSRSVASASHGDRRQRQVRLLEWSWMEELRQSSSVFQNKK